VTHDGQCAAGSVVPLIRAQRREGQKYPGYGDCRDQQERQRIDQDVSAEGCLGDGSGQAAQSFPFGHGVGEARLFHVAVPDGDHGLGPGRPPGEPRRVSLIQCPKAIHDCYLSRIPSGHSIPVRMMVQARFPSFVRHRNMV
jgi:hypothetical protein